MNKRKIELLAPAKNLETGIAAIQFGADAIYIGATNYGARAGAKNNISDIEALVQFAHLYHARVYVTLNTILFDQELQDVEKLIWQLYDIGVDAIIIQDMAILEMDIPPIAIHASTQANNVELQKIQFLENVGFDRVVLARELSIKEINHIKQNTSIELEAFIHGALCVSYSGQCYLSHQKTGRSGNRGECAQLCRLSYDLLDENKNILIKNKHLLSIKDFSAEKHIEALLDSGITSFKIEGRLKDINYVKNIVAYYRIIIDKLLEKKKWNKTSSGTVNFDFIPDKYKSFNRGLTDYFLNGRKEKIGSPNTPKSLGKEIGKVISSNDKGIQIKVIESIVNGDGLCYFDDKNNIQGFYINNINNNFIKPHNNCQPSKETVLFRNYDSQFNKTLENTKTERKIKISFSIQDSEEGFLLVINDEDHIYSEITIPSEKVLTNNPTKNKEAIYQNLNKLGNTPYQLSSLDYYWNNDYFIPMSILSEARRKIIEIHTEKRINKHPIVRKQISPNNIAFYIDNADYRLNIANKLSEKFYTHHQVEIADYALEISQPKKDIHLMTSKYCIRYEYNICPKHNKTNEKKATPLFLKDQNQYLYQLNFDCHNCLMLVKKENEL